MTNPEEAVQYPILKKMEASQSQNIADMTSWQQEMDVLRGASETISYWHNSSGGVETKTFGPEEATKLRTLRDHRNVDLNEFGLPPEARLGRVDVALVNVDKPEDVKVAFVGGIHADELNSPTAVEKTINFAGQMREVPRAEIYEANPEAAMLGRRDNLVPIDAAGLESLSLDEVSSLVILPGVGKVELSDGRSLGLDLVVNGWTETEQSNAKQKLDELLQQSGRSIDSTQPLRIQEIMVEIGKLAREPKTRETAAEAFLQVKPYLRDMVQESSDWILAKKINLNRQFPFTEDTTSLDAARQKLKDQDPQARLLLEATAGLPGLEYIFSFHEDPEFGTNDPGRNTELTDGQLESEEQGFYVYDAHYDANDADNKLVVFLKSGLAAALKRKGFYVKNGLDDPNDPALGFRAEQGYIDQPIVNKDGQLAKSDKSYESGMAALGRNGALKVKRAFCFEVPGKLSFYRKEDMLAIIQEEFILPFLRAQKIIEGDHIYSNMVV